MRGDVGESSKVEYILTKKTENTQVIGVRLCGDETIPSSEEKVSKLTRLKSW